MTYDPSVQKMIGDALAQCAHPAPLPYQLVDFEGVTPETWISLGCASEWSFEAVMVRRDAAERQVRADHQAERAYLRNQAAKSRMAA